MTVSTVAVGSGVSESGVAEVSRGKGEVTSVSRGVTVVGCIAVGGSGVGVRGSISVSAVVGGRGEVTSITVVGRGGVVGLVGDLSDGEGSVVSIATEVTGAQVTSETVVSVTVRAIRSDKGGGLSVRVLGMVGWGVGEASVVCKSGVVAIMRGGSHWVDLLDCRRVGTHDLAGVSMDSSVSVLAEGHGGEGDEDRGADEHLRNGEHELSNDNSHVERYCSRSLLTFMAVISPIGKL